MVSERTLTIKKKGLERVLCKGKAPLQCWLAGQSQQEGKQSPPDSTTVTFIMSIVCLSLFRQASTFNLSAGRLEIK